MTEDNLFAEVQQDLERQKLEALWKKYGPFILAAAVAIVVATASVTSYRSWKAEHAQDLTARMIEATKPEAAADKIASLQKFADENQATTQTDLALLQAGSLAAEQGDKTKAADLFDRVAKDSKADPAFRQLGDLLYVQTQLDSGDTTMLAARLQPLTEENAVWRYSALEDQAYLALRTGDKVKARQIFTDLSQDARTPHGISLRAADILRSLD